MPLPQPAAQDDTLSELLKLINRQLTEKNLKIEKASAAVIDATIIQTAGGKQRQAIEVDEEGHVSGQTTPGKDSDARRTKKNGLYKPGYKQHTRTDEEGYIGKLHITPPIPMSATTCRLCRKALPKARPSMPTKATTVRKTGNI